MCIRDRRERERERERERSGHLVINRSMIYIKMASWCCSCFIVVAGFLVFCLFVVLFFVVLFVCLFQFKCCFTSTETAQTIRDGEPRTAASTFTQLLCSAARASETDDLKQGESRRVQCCRYSGVHALTPSLPKPVKKNPGRKVHAHACKQYIFSGPITNLLSVPCVLMPILSRVTRKRKQNCFRMWNFILLPVFFKWQNGTERVNCDLLTFLRFTIQTADAQSLPDGFQLFGGTDRFRSILWTVSVVRLCWHTIRLRSGSDDHEPYDPKRLVYQRVSRHLGCMQSIPGRHPSIDPI